MIDVKQIANGQMKICSRKPLLLRHWNFSSNELLLARVFYSPIIAPNVKFGFVLCAVHRWISENPTFDHVIERFLTRENLPLWNSSDELAVICYEIHRGTNHHYQSKKSNNDNFLSLQRLCRFNRLLNTNTKQLQIFENQLLQIYRHRLAQILSNLFSKILNKLSALESAIYSICCKDDSYSSSGLLMCPLCNSALIMNNNDLLFSQCSNKHSWPRCSRTLLPLPMECAETCALCDQTMTSMEMNEKTWTNFVKYKDKQLNFLFSSLCTFCL